MLEVLENNRYSVTPRADADTKRWAPALTAVTGGLLSIPLSKILILKINSKILIRLKPTENLKEKI